MAKLKTLKDLKQRSLTINFHNEKGILISELKQEAINHIKFIRDGKVVNKSGHRLRNMELVVIDWIKYFFNITEEDLK